MIKLQLINADILYDTDWTTSQAGWIREWIYVFCFLHIEEFWKMVIPIFGATCNFNDQIIPYGILFLAFINTDVFYLLSFKFSR